MSESQIYVPGRGVISLSDFRAQFEKQPNLLAKATPEEKEELRKSVLRAVFQVMEVKRRGLHFSEVQQTYKVWKKGAMKTSRLKNLSLNKLYGKGYLLKIITAGQPQHVVSMEGIKFAGIEIPQVQPVQIPPPSPVIQPTPPPSESTSAPPVQTPSLSSASQEVKKRGRPPKQPEVESKIEL